MKISEDPQHPSRTGRPEPSPPSPESPDSAGMSPDGDAAEDAQGTETPASLDSLNRIAITGGSSFLGGLILKRLAELPSVREIHIFDVRAPEVSSSKFVYHRLDLTRDAADAELAEILIKSGIKTFIHGALFSGPGRGAGQRREVESIGTFHMLNAVAEADVKKLIVLSHTFVYGAHSQNPNFLPESTALKTQGPDFVKARVDVERQIKEFASDYPQTRVTVLRFAPILGPNSDNVRARYFVAGVIPKVLGYDPLLQFIHEDDALRAALLALSSPVKGVFNIVGRGVLPLSTGIHMSGRLPVPVATPVCKTVFSIGFLLRVWDLPPSLVPFYQYLCVADGRRAEKELGFRARYSSRQALKAMIEAHRLRSVGFAVPTRALGEDEGMAMEQGFERVF